MKTKEELEALKNEYENLSKKLSELSDEEIKEVVGGAYLPNEAEDKLGRNWAKKADGVVIVGNDNGPIRH